MKIYVPANPEFENFNPTTDITNKGREKEHLSDRKATHGFWTVMVTASLVSEIIYAYFAFMSMKENVKDINSDAVVVPLALALTLIDLIYNISTFELSSEAQDYTLAARNPLNSMFDVKLRVNSVVENLNLGAITPEQQQFASRFIKFARSVSIIPSYLPLALADAIAVNSLTSDPAVRIVAATMLAICGTIYYQCMTDASYAEVGTRLAVNLSANNTLARYISRLPIVGSGMVLTVKLLKLLVENLIRSPLATIEVIKQVLSVAFHRGLSALTIVYWLTESLPQSTQDVMRENKITETLMMTVGICTAMSAMMGRSKGTLNRYFNPKFANLLSDDGQKIPTYFSGINIPLKKHLFDAGVSALPSAGLALLVANLVEQPEYQIVGYVVCALLMIQSYLAEHSRRIWDAALVNYESRNKKDNPATSWSTTQLCNKVTELYKTNNVVLATGFILFFSQLARMWGTVGFVNKLRTDSPISQVFPHEGTAQDTMVNYGLVILIYTPIFISTLLWQTAPVATSMAANLARLLNCISPFTAPANFPVPKATAILRDGKGHTFWGAVRSVVSCFPCCKENSETTRLINETDIEAGMTTYKIGSTPPKTGSPKAAGDNIDDLDFEEVRDDTARRNRSEPAVKYTNNNNDDDNSQDQDSPFLSRRPGTAPALGSKK